MNRSNMKPIICLKKVSKSFPGVKAVDDVSMDVYEGEVLALLGENGAGKSTLIKIICGVLSADEGEIVLNDQRTHFETASDAVRNGINVVYQELSLVGNLSVAENIYMTNPPITGGIKVNWAALNRNARDILRRFKLELDPKTPVKRLSMGQQQMVEILKAIATSPRLLILDEPTSSLTDSETESLFHLIRELKKMGVSFIYITHKLSEVFDIADRVYIMRDGVVVCEMLVSDADENALISQMVGREVRDLYGRSGSVGRGGENLLKVMNLSRRNRFENISFDLHRGEILGFAGLVGAGRTEMALSLFGGDPKDGGTVEILGKKKDIRNPSDAIRSRIAYLTEDRKELGLYLKYTLRDNLIAPNLKRLTGRAGVVAKKNVNAFVEDKIRRYNIVSTSSRQKVGTLSGGNQQKCLYSMWIGTEPDILILDEPTRGIDVGAREEMYRNIRTFAEKGGGVILISSDMPELIGLSDSIIVMYEGQISGRVDRKDFSEQTILSMAAGIHEGVQT